MCRFAVYLGEPVLMEDLLYEPDGALVRQALDPELMSLLNVGGSGVAAWDPGSPDPRRPLTYRVPALPNFDRNLRVLAGKVRAGALVAHVRGVLTAARRGTGSARGSGHAPGGGRDVRQISWQAVARRRRRGDVVAWPAITTWEEDP